MSSDKVKAVTEKAESDALDAAYRVIKKVEESESVAAITKAVLSALGRCRDVEREASRGLDESKEEYLHLDEFHIVATAMWMVFNQGDVVDEIEPYCIGAVPFLGFARAALVLEALANVDVLVDYCEESPLGSSHCDEALQAIERAERRHEALEASAAERKNVATAHET